MGKSLRKAAARKTSRDNAEKSSASLRLAIVLDDKPEACATSGEFRRDFAGGKEDR